MATIADRIKAARGVDGDSNSTSRVVELVRGRLSGIVEANRIREEEEKRKKTEENLRKSQEEAQKNIEEFQKQRDSLGGRFYSMLGAMPTLPSLSIEGEDYTRAREEDEAGMSARLEKKSHVASFKESVDEKGFFNTVGDIEAGAAENLLELASGTAKLAVGFTPFGGYSNVRKIAKFIGNDQVDEYIDRNTPEWMEQTGSWLDENGILNYKADYKNEMQKTGGVVAEIGTFFIPLSRALKIEKAISLVPKFAKILGTAPKVAKVGGKFVLEVSLDVLDNVALDAMRGQDADTILENAKYSAIGGAGLRAVGGGLGAALKKGKTNRLIATMEGSGLGKLSDEESKIASEIINDGRPIDDAYTKIIERRSEEGTLADDFGDIFKEDVPAVKTSATQEIPKTPDSQKLPDSPEVKNGIAPETKPADVETPKVEKVETPTVKKEAESPLIQEAKKYKSAEEFVKAQEKFVEGKWVEGKYVESQNEKLNELKEGAKKYLETEKENKKIYDEIKMLTKYNSDSKRGYSSWINEEGKSRFISNSDIKKIQAGEKNVLGNIYKNDYRLYNERENFFSSLNSKNDAEKYLNLLKKDPVDVLSQGVRIDRNDIPKSVVENEILPALRIFNKTTKKLREQQRRVASKIEFEDISGRFNKQHEKLHLIKDEKDYLYKIKDNLIKWLSENNYLKEEGYHIIGDEPFILYSGKNNTTFHIPVSEQDVVGLKNLGKIDEIPFVRAKEKFSVKEAENIIYNFFHDGSKMSMGIATDYRNKVGMASRYFSSNLEKLDNIKTKSQLTDIWNKANKSQPLQEGVEKVSNEIPKSKPKVETPKVEGNAKQKKVVSDKQPEVPKKTSTKTESPIIKRVNELLDDAEKLDPNLDTTSHRKQLSIVENELADNPEKVYNDAVFGDVDGGSLKTTKLVALLENAKNKNDYEAIAEITMALARHGRKSGQEIEMIKAMLGSNPTNKAMEELARMKLIATATKFKKIVIKEGEDIISATSRVIKSKSKEILKRERIAKVKEARNLIRSLSC